MADTDEWPVEDPLASSEAGGSAPLSVLQQPLWLIHEESPDRAACNISIGLKSSGLPDPTALEAALGEIVARHQALRTRFRLIDGVPRQVVAEPSRVTLRTIDDAGSLEWGHDWTAPMCGVEEAGRPFDLAEEQMLRAVLIRGGTRSHLLLITHRLVADARSLEILRDECLRLYEAFANGKPARLPLLPRQYVDFAADQHAWLHSDEVNAPLQFWRRQLQGSPARLELPTDHPRPPRPRTPGAARARQRLELSATLTESLEILSREEECSLFVTVLGAFDVLLSRYSGQTDIAVSAPVSGRTHPDVEQVIGPFAHTHLLRIDLSGNPSGREVLRRVREVVRQAAEHEALPFASIVEHLRAEGDSDSPPRPQICFSLDEHPAPLRLAGGLEWILCDPGSETVEFELALILSRTDHGIAGWVEYSSDLFVPATIERMIGHAEILLDGIASHPNHRLSELPLLTPAEWHRILVEWNAAAFDYPCNATVVTLFEAQARRTPDATALVGEGAILTYRELNERASVLAAHLRHRGVERETLVGICVERSWQMVAGILAILKAGGAYVPLDPAYPAQRLAFITNDARLRVVLTQDSLVPLFSSLPATDAAGGGPDLVCLGSDWEPLRNSTRDPNAPGVEAGNLMVVIYTSGSTGNPKGVALEHRSVSALMHWAHRTFAAEDRAGVLASTSICFDLSIFEMFVPLCGGGSVILAGNALQLPALAARNRVTLVNTVPSAMKELLRAEGVPDSVRVINLAGEPLPTWLVTRIYEETRVHSVYDLYGPTETTVYSTCTRRDADAPATIGRPLPNEHIYLLDAHRQPVPIGVTGEIYIGGAGLARGYFNRPELTAERFVRHAFSPDAPAERLFRTGDLGRHRPDGNIEFLGRIDHQVKIRGFRIELGEIEATLRQHPAIREAIVVAREDDSADRRLVAYYVARRQPATTAEELRTFLHAKLASYMVPSLFVALDQLPLTPNGKVDRRALPPPDWSLLSRDTEFIAPRGRTERELVRIWEEILRVRPIGIRHHFFELGGDSLLAARIATRIASVLGRRLPAGAIFESPTIEQLARRLSDRSEESRTPPSIVEIQRGGAQPPLFLVHGMGGGMFWGYANLARRLGPAFPVYAFNSRGLRGEREFDTIEEMAAHYAAELRAFQPRGPYHVGGYCFGGNVAYEIARRLLAQGETVALLALFNCPARNSSYQHIRITPDFCLKFMRNIHRRARHVLSLPGQRRRDFLRWKTRVMLGKCGRLLGRTRSGPPAADPAEWEDLSRLPDERKQLWSAHIRAYLAHQHQPYGGHVTLFRTRDHEMFCSFDEAYGWREFAAGVTVRILPGAHESVFEEPFVEAAAAAVQASLAAGRSGG